MKVGFFSYEGRGIRIGQYIGIGFTRGRVKAGLLLYHLNSAEGVAWPFRRFWSTVAPSAVCTEITMARGEPDAGNVSLPNISWPSRDLK